MKQKAMMGIGLALVIIVALLGYDQVNAWIQRRKLAAAAAAAAPAAAASDEAAA